MASVPRRDSLRAMLDLLVRATHSKGKKASLEALLEMVEPLREAALLLDIANELGRVTYALNPEFDALFTFANTKEDIEAFKRFQKLMEDEGMPEAAYPAQYDELLVYLHKGIPAEDEFMNSIPREFDDWATIDGFLQLQARKAVRTDDPVRAAYILSLLFLNPEIGERELGFARTMHVYDLYTLIDRFREELD